MQRFLEPEDEDARQKRIRIALEKMNKRAANSAEPPATFDFGERKTHPVEPPTELLSRIQAFLPQIEASNALITQQAQVDPRSVDIEAIQDSDTSVIEMNLGLGVFKIRDRTSRSDDSESDGGDSSESMSDSDDSSSDTNNSATSSLNPRPRSMHSIVRVLDAKTSQHGLNAIEVLGDTHSTPPG